MKEKFERFKNEKTVINVKSKKQYDEFMKMCEEQGLKWGSGSFPTQESYYNKYKEETCINLNNLRGLSYDGINFYKAYGFKIITYKDFMKEEKQDGFTGVKWYTNGVEVASCTYDGLLIQKNIEEKPVEILDEVEKKWLKTLLKALKLKLLIL